jgi:Universal stress protein family
MFKRVLVAYDGSTAALKAFERSLEMAQCFGAQLAIVVVLRPPEFAEEVETRAVIENARNRFDPEIASLLTRARASGLEPTTYTVADPAGRSGSAGRSKLVGHRPPTNKAHASHRCGLYGVPQFQRCADVPESFLGATRSGDENVPIAKNPRADALVDRHRLDLLNLHFERSPF